MRRWSILVVLAPAAMLVTGCAALFPGFISSSGVDTIVGEGALPSAEATYTSGRATLKMTQGTDTQTVTLGEVGAGSQLTSLVGAGVTWRNEDGWALQLMAFDPSSMGAGGLVPSGIQGQLTIERINGNDLWTTQSDTEEPRCIVTVDQLTATDISGEATCKGLRWEDGFAGNQLGIGDPSYIQGQAPFDLDITFAAKP